MALYHFTVKVLNMAKESAVHRAAYHARTQLFDDRSGTLTRDYAYEGDHAWGGIFAPVTKDARPDWMSDRAKAWNKAEAAERQFNGQPARNFEMAVPNELSRKQQIQLCTDFTRDQISRKGLFSTGDLHSDYDAEGKILPGKNPNEPRNDHYHLLCATRFIDGQEFSKTKTDARKFNTPEQLVEWRQQWAKYGAKALHKAGFHTEAERFAVGHMTLPEQRKAAIARGDTAWANQLDREPDMKQGAVIMQMEKRGQKTERGDERRALQARNAKRARLTSEFNIVNLRLERIRRQEQAETRAEARRDFAKAAAKQAGVSKIQGREKDRFESWANGKRAELQTARHEAEGEHGRAQDFERLGLENTLATSYGTIKKQYAASLETIAKRQQRQQGKGVAAVLYRFSGKARKDADLAKTYRATLADIARRETEQRQALAGQQRTATVALESRHAAQARQLEKRIETARQRRENEGWQPPQTRREATTGQEIEPSATIDTEAENSPVEGRDGGTVESVPGNEQATTAQPESTPEANSGDGQKPPQWDRAAAIEAEYQRQAQQDSGRDPGTGREIE